MLQAINLRKDIDGQPMFKDVNFMVTRGEVVSLIGASTTGKSALLRCLCRLETPDQGSLRFHGEEIAGDSADIPSVRRRIALVATEPDFDERQTVLENVITAPCELPGTLPALPKDRARELLARVGLTARESVRVGELSVGQHQRLAIARALSTKPDILLLDDPTADLDLSMAAEVLNIIGDLASAGQTIIIATQDMSFVRDNTSRVLFLQDGQVFDEGAPKDVFRGQCRPETAAFVAQAYITQARERLRIFRGEVLDDGHIDEMEAEMLRRILLPLHELGTTDLSGFEQLLDDALEDDIITAAESKTLANVLRSM